MSKGSCFSESSAQDNVGKLAVLCNFHCSENHLISASGPPCEASELITLIPMEETEVSFFFSFIASSPRYTVFLVMEPG